MSKIDEIRKRHQDQARRALTCGLANTPEHRDRAALLAALDGEWQSERPTYGEWWLSLHPERRGGRPDVMLVEVQNCYVWLPTFETPLNKDSVLLDGALWQRRTVPGDPFKGAAR